MKADTYSLATIFGKDARYIVPLYQRPYVWRKDTHWDPLWSDVRTIVEQVRAAETSVDGADGASVTAHFLGAVVLEQQLVPAGEIDARWVIDGQQRLTTLQLFLAAAARSAREAGAERPARLLRRLVENDPDLVARPEHAFKVWPTNANREAFATVMHPDGPPADRSDDGGNLIDEAYAYFYETLTGWLKDEEGAAPDPEGHLSTLAGVARDLLKMVVIDLEPGDNAQVIFETLNARGTPLLAVDLVKNLVFQRVDGTADLDEVYNAFWKPFDSEDWREKIRQGRLHVPRAEIYLMHWLTMKRAEDVSAHQLFPKFRAVLDAEAKHVGPLELLREFARDASTYRSFAGSFFERMSILDTTTALPVALLLYKRVADDFAVEDRDLALAMIESWLVRRTVCHLTTKAYNRLFVELLRRLQESATPPHGVVHDFLRSGEGDSSRWPTDEEFVAALRSAPLYRQLTRARLSMLLREAERSLRSSKAEDVAIPSGLTIEHVLPQTWGEHWPVDPPDDAAKIQLRSDHVHVLGNLTLVTSKLNPSLANAAWPTKRPALNQHSVLLLNRKLVDEHPEVWDESTITERGAELAERLRPVWPGPDSEAWASAAALSTEAQEVDGV
jgi:hypothetical protein